MRVDKRAWVMHVDSEKAFVSTFDHVDNQDNITSISEHEETASTVHRRRLVTDRIVRLSRRETED
jgi:hypothetical protein